MKKIKVWALCLCAGLAATMAAPVMAEEAETEVAAEATEDENQLSAPTDFTFDPETGDYSFTMTDERMGYYFIRVYALDADGEETGEYVASSKRINGGSTGEVSGTIDLGSLAWGSYHVNLVCFAPAGTDYVKPETQSITMLAGRDLILERPEFMLMVSGNSVELVVDWYTLSDYYVYEYLPEMLVTVYADAECTEEVMTDTIDLSELADTVSAVPPMSAYAWGFSMSLTDDDHVYTITPDENTEVSFAFINDIYEYTLEAGTYYMTLQALAKDEYTQSSQVSEVVEFTVTDGERTSEYVAYQSPLWTDEIYGAERILSQAGTQEDRVDLCTEQVVVYELLED